MELAGLIGADGDELESRLGAPDARRTVGDDRWLIYRREAATLRVRCVAGGRPGPRVASWTVTWQEPRPTLREAVEPLGLWPACAPDVEAGDVETEGGRMVRRVLSDPSGPGAHSLTAGVAGGGFDRVAAFDEAPEWT
jgi:hypothetical protein